MTGDTESPTNLRTSLRTGCEVMAKYEMYDTGKRGKAELKTEYSTILDARRYAISQIAKRNKDSFQNFQLFDSHGLIELIQSRNDGRSNFIGIVRGSGGNKSYFQIINPKGEPVSPKLSVYTQAQGWKRKLPTLYKYSDRS